MNNDYSIGYLIRQEAGDRSRKLRSFATNRSEAELGEAKSRFGGIRSRKTGVRSPKRSPHGSILPSSSSHRSFSEGGLLQSP